VVYTVVTRRQIKRSSIFIAVIIRLPKRVGELPVTDLPTPVKELAAFTRINVSENGLEVVLFYLWQQSIRYDIDHRLVRNLVLDIQ
jgi:hypothetical protein